MWSFQGFQGALDLLWTRAQRHTRKERSPNGVILGVFFSVSINFCHFNILENSSDHLFSGFDSSLTVFKVKVLTSYVMEAELQTKQPFTCVLNRFLDKNLQVSSYKCKWISIIFSTWVATSNFLPWDMWNCRGKKKSTKPIKWQLMFSAFNNTNTLVTEKNRKYWSNLLGHITLWWLQTLPWALLSPIFHKHKCLRVNVSNLCSPANLV